MNVAGYSLCQRASHCWVRDEVARRTGGLCPDCFAREGGAILRSIELVGRGMRIQIPLSIRQHRKRKPTETRIARKKLNGKIRDAARKRLAQMLPDLYDIVLADERAKAGLEPWPVEIAIRGNDPSTEIGFAAMLTELKQAGIDTT